MNKLILIGNTGVGRSTILNSLVGEVVPRSRNDAVAKWHQTRLGMVCCALGLSDAERRQQNGKEIELAFKSGGVFKIAFVVVLEHGRVTSDDLTTISHVISTLPSTMKYGVIVNKIPLALKRTIDGNPFSAMNPFFLLPVRPSEYAFILQCEHLEDKENILCKPSEELQRFFDKLDDCIIDPKSVRPLETCDFDLVREEYAQIIEDLAGYMPSCMKLNSRTMGDLHITISNAENLCARVPSLSAIKSFIEVAVEGKCVRSNIAAGHSPVWNATFTFHGVEFSSEIVVIVNQVWNKLPLHLCTARARISDLSGSHGCGRFELLWRNHMMNKKSKACVRLEFKPKEHNSIENVV